MEVDVDASLLDLSRWRALDASAQRDVVRAALPAGWTVEEDGCVHVATGWRFRVVPVARRRRVAGAALGVHEPRPRA